MPPITRPSYSFHGHFTGSILLLGLVSLPSVARSSELEPTPPLPAESSASVPELEIAGEAVLSVSARASRGPENTALRPHFSLSATPELMAELALGAAAPGLANQPERLVPWPAAPATGSGVAPTATLNLALDNSTQEAPRFTPSEATAPAGAPVPWYTAQIQQLPPGVTTPPAATPPNAGAYYPAVPYPGGAWVMVWMPYGAFMAAPDAGSMSVGVPPWPQPAGGFPVSTPYGGAPGYWTGSAPAYPATVGALPWGTPYGLAAGPYGTAATPSAIQGAIQAPYGYSAVPSLPATTPSYPQTPAVGGLPLGVPGLPAGTASGTLPPLPQSQPWGQVSLPPVAPGTYLPAENFGRPSSLGQASGFEASPLAPEAAIATPVLPEPNLNIQGLYVVQDDNSSARARLSGDAFLTPNLLVGGALDLVTGPDLTNRDGVQLTELYLATSVPGAPGLRFRLGQLDLTSYFDRNSFAKDISRDFFNAVFQTNPALIGGANATASRPGGLVQWAVTDDITLNAAVFSSSSDITDFALDGFAGEVGFRTGDLILRGTFLTSRDTEFQNTGGRLDAYGINAEWFMPQANLGLFGRYGQLNNSGSGFSGDTYSFGLNLFDVFMEDDRLGLGYGRNLSTATADGRTPDALELFYDFELIPSLRLGLTFQQRNQFQESFAGFRIRSDFNLLPGRSLE